MTNRRISADRIAEVDATMARKSVDRMMDEVDFSTTELTGRRSTSAGGRVMDIDPRFSKQFFERMIRPA